MGDISGDQIQQLIRCVQMVAARAMVVDMMDNMLREAAVIQRFYQIASAQYQDYGLVRLIIDLLNAQMEIGLISRPFVAPGNQHIIQLLAEADEILQDHPDRMGFRQFLYELAMVIVNADGDVNRKISAEESEFLELLKTKWDK
jgi:hypothetical protein